jgi:hypothetical protein
MGITEKYSYVNITSVMDMCIAVSKRAVFGYRENGTCGVAMLSSEAAGFCEGVKDFVGKDGEFIV